MKFIKIRKSILILFVTSCVTLLFSGYVNKNTDIYLSTEKSEIKSAKINIQEETTEIKTIEPPEDGWTWEKLSDVIYINNKKIESDITYEFLKTMFTFDDITYFENMSTASAFLNYNDNYAFAVAFYYNSPNKINETSIVKNLVFSSKRNNSDIPNEELVSINGVGLGTNYENMILQLGSPTEINDNANIYVLGGDTIVFFIDDEKTIYFISIILEEQK